MPSNTNRTQTTLLALVAGGLLAAPSFAQNATIHQARLTTDFTGELAAEEAVDNAALLYNRAWQLGDVTIANATVRGEDWAVTPDLAESLKANQQMIETIIRATKVKDCDWGIEYDQGFNALLPHLGTLRSSARLLTADARRLAEAGDPVKAAQRLDAVIRMAGHLSNDRVVISGLVAMAIAQLGADEAANLIESGQLPRTRARLVERRIKAIDLADPFSLTDAVRGEQEILKAWIAGMEDGEAGQTLSAMTAQFGGRFQDQFAGMTDAQIDADVELLGKYYNDALTMWKAGDAAERYVRLDAALEAGAYGLIAQAFAANLARVRDATDRFDEHLTDALAMIEGD